MRIRRAITLTCFLSFFVTLLTSIVLYIVPQGRVAYWADWRLWGLSKGQWGAIHINVGFLFLFALLFHLFYNWKPIMVYLKNKAKQVKVFTKEFNIALVVTATFVVGTYAEVPPFSTIINFSESFKEATAKEYGEPPYGHAELSSLKTFSQRMSINLANALQLIKDAGYHVENEGETLQEIAKNNGISPQKLYSTIAKATEKPLANGSALPDKPAPGLGKRTLADLCSQHNLPIKKVVRALNEAGINSKAEMTIKEIAADNAINPIDVYKEVTAIAGLK